LSKKVWNSSSLYDKCLEKKYGIPPPSMGECVDMQGKKSGIPVMIWQKRLEFQTKKGITKAGIPTPSIGGGPLFSGIAH